MEAQAPVADLSEREMAVLRRVVDGRTYQQIADEFRLGYETVNTYMKRIRGKLGVRSKTGMVVWALRNRKV